MTNMSSILMLVCTLNKAIVNPSIIYYKLWLVANGVTIVDTIIDTPVTISTDDVAIYSLHYDFKFYYFALVNLASNNITSGITVHVGTQSATLNP